MKSIKILSLLMALIMLVGVFAACTKDPVNDPDNKPTDNATGDNNKPTDDGKNPNPDEGFVADGKDYTYTTGTTALGTNWNPHAWETNADQSMLSYVSSPFVDMSILDSENGVYQWVYEMATSIKDVTKDHQGDLDKYGSTLPAGAETSADVEAGFVFEIALNPDAAWETGEKITADDYIESMKRLLDSKMRNYRANLYIAGESALAGGAAFYNSEAPIYAPIITYVPTGVEGEDDVRTEAVDPSTVTPLLNLTTEDMTMASYSFTFMLDYAVDKDLYKKLGEQANAYGYIAVTDENYNDVVTICDQYLAAFGMTIYNVDEEGNPILDADGNKTVNVEYLEEFFFYFTETYGDKVEYDAVGCYKVDDYTIRYVTQTYIGINYFLTSCTDTWLVYTKLYDELKDDSGELVTTTYATSKETTMSYGTYRMESLEKDKQAVFVRNEKWYGWETDKNGNLYSFTNFEVDGEKRQQYKTTKIVINVMDEAAMKQAFLKGDLSDWSPSAEELSTYALSDQLYKVDETYTMSFFFNTNLDMLKTMDESKGNTNSVVLSNETFRKAFSLAIDRAEFVTATQGYKPAFSLMNSLYYYDIYDDDKEDGIEGANTNYRLTDQAMQAIVNLYGVKYGEGTPYATLKDAHDSITGYNLTEAKKLMATALEELVAAGLYNKGEEIKILIGWAKGALTSDDNKQVELMNKYINQAASEAGFGKITLEAVGNITDRYNDVPAGNYAIGYGAWGGAAFYPFRNFQVYMDPDQYDINEAANYNPRVDTITLTVDGKEVTKTWQEWSNSMIGSGEFAAASSATKLDITAQLEEAFLKTYYRIPLCASTICSMLSYQCKYYTEDYNIMYGFGGMRLMDYTLDDVEWAKWADAKVAENGEIDYQ